MEALAPMPTVPRSPKPKLTPLKETHKLEKDKQKRMVLVRKSPRKHTATRKKKKDKQLEKVVDLEAKQGTEDIDAKGMKPITKIP